MLEQEIASFDPSLPKILAQRNLAPTKILYKKDKWGSIVLQAKSLDGRSRCVVKCCRAGSKKKTLSRFAREMEFYKSFGWHEAVAELIEARENLLILGYLDGTSLNKWMSSYVEDLYEDRPTEKFKGVLTVVFAHMESLFLDAQKLVTCEMTQRADIITRQLMGFFFRLCRSGPLEKNRSCFAHCCSSILALIAKIPVEKCLRTHVERVGQLPEGLAWGDFHLNNILVSDTGEVWFIDFGEADFNGCFLVDLLYFSAILGSYLRKLPKHKAFLEGLLRETVLPMVASCGELFFTLLPVMELAISINSRFQIGATKAEIAKAHLTFLPRLWRLLGRFSF